MLEVVLATGNAGKIREMNKLAEDLSGIRFIPQKELCVESVDELGTTFVENAIAKARHASQQTGKPALADDSGLSVPALAGAPGIISARYARDGATDQENVNCLLKNMVHLPEDKRVACFHSVIVYLPHATHPLPDVFHGVWQGRILTEPQGTDGFGYDPVFYVPTHHCSAAELSLDIKNQISHRGQAMSAFRDFMREVEK